MLGNCRIISLYSRCQPIDPHLWRLSEMSNLLAVEMVGELRPELFRLIRDPSRATPVRLWRALTREERTEAALAFLQSGGERARPSIIANIARSEERRVGKGSREREAEGS